MNDYLSLSDIRKMAVRVHCINLTTPRAKETFIKRLNQLVTRAPKIKFWS